MSQVLVYLIMQAPKKIDLLKVFDVWDISITQIMYTCGQLW